MRLRLSAIAIFAIILCAGGLMPVSAQSTFTQGFYEFESTIGSMSYISGTWATTTVAGSMSIARSTASSGGRVDFDVSGHTLIVWRYIRASSASSRMDICINGVICTSINNESSSSAGYWYPFTITLPGGTNTISIFQTLGTIFLDSFMVLDTAGGGFPTAVPTATILPSSTPMTTTTPQPTPTPQPTATPYTMPGAVFAIDPQRDYNAIGDQIVSYDYTTSAGEVHLANLLTMLLFSIWGMFLLQVFILSRFKNK